MDTGVSEKYRSPVLRVDMNGGVPFFERDEHGPKTN
jgi:hypothetical protein